MVKIKKKTAIKGGQEGALRDLTAKAPNHNTFNTPTVRLTSAEYTALLDKSIASVRGIISVVAKELDAETKARELAKANPALTMRNDHGHMMNGPSTEMRLGALRERLDMLEFTHRYLAPNATFDIEASAAFAFLNGTDRPYYAATVGYRLNA